MVDGMSDDETRNIIAKFGREYPWLRGLYNSKKITAAALNLGIRRSSGEIICRIDAHARVAPDYLRLCVTALSQYCADNAGGAMETLPAHNGLIAKAIAASMSHPFGVGNSDFRVGTGKAIFTDTVFGGCYRREVFDRIGLFNECLTRSQDMEFNQRLWRAGGRIVLDPKIKCSYYAPPDLGSFWRHNFNDGMWAILPVAYTNVWPVRWRHLVPLAFVAAIIISVIVGIWSAWFRLLLVAILGAYTVANIVSSGHVAWRKRDLRLLLLMPLVFGIRHFCYGVGSLCGLAKLTCHHRFPRHASGGARYGPV